jgi:hypothetical protein
MPVLAVDCPCATRLRLSRLSVVALCALGVALASASAARAGGDPMRRDQWGLDMIGADAAHRVSVGAGVTVAIIDTGVDANHPDLAGAVIKGPDLITGDGDPADENGHGTAVAGVVGARANNGIGIEGVAPGSRLLAIRVLGANGTGDTNTAATAIDAAVAAGAQVINLSLSEGPQVIQALLPYDRLTHAIENAAAAGVVVVAAAGNDALPLCEQPILLQRIICVGAVNRRDQRSSYSNFGVRVDLVAPGGDDDSTDDEIVTTNPGGGYGWWTGTSLATPMVSGAAALLVAQGLRGTQVIDRLEATARDVGLPGNDLVYGHGVVDAAAAVGAPPPVATPAAATLWARLPRHAKISTLLRGRLSVRCAASIAATCSTQVTGKHGAVLAKGSRRLAANTPATIRLNPTRSGRRTLRRTHRLKARLLVSAIAKRITKDLALRR